MKNGAGACPMAGLGLGTADVLLLRRKRARGEHLGHYNVGSEREEI